jgi:hypothetical protein
MPYLQPFSKGSISEWRGLSDAGQKLNTVILGELFDHRAKILKAVILIKKCIGVSSDSV